MHDRMAGINQLQIKDGDELQDSVRKNRANTMSFEETYLEDCDGNTIPVYKYNGLILPRHKLNESIPERMTAINQLQGKDGDVLQVSFPKTGTNWVGDMLSMLKNNNTELDMKLADILLEFAPDFSRVLNQTEPRSFATHLPVDRLPESLLKSAKIVLVCRNPKDAAVSFMHQMRRERLHHYKGNWNAFFGMEVAGQVPFGSFFEYYRAWDEAIRKHPEYKVLLIYYEDFHRDSVATLRKLCNFLEYDRTDDILKAITEKCRFSTIKPLKEAHPVAKMLIEKFSLDDSFPIFRKGVIGDWKNHFTVAQSEIFDKLLEDNLKDTMFNFVWEMPK